MCRRLFFVPANSRPVVHPQAFGDRYTITAFGRVWLQEAKDRPYIDPSCLAQLLCTFSKRFGEGYEQRPTESVKTYRTNKWLAACVLAGAAAESRRRGHYAPSEDYAEGFWQEGRSTRRGHLALGQKRKCSGSRGTSVLPSGADIVSLPRHVRLVPED